LPTGTQDGTVTSQHENQVGITVGKGGKGPAVIGRQDLQTWLRLQQTFKFGPCGGDPRDFEVGDDNQPEG
jgi:hypothetical protein